MSNSTLIYGLATLGSGILTISLRYCFKSKCSDVKLCYGLVTVKRDTEAEVKSEEMELKNMSKQKSESNLNSV
jgi:hypothetical protein